MPTLDEIVNRINTTPAPVIPTERASSASLDDIVTRINSTPAPVAAAPRQKPKPTAPTPQARNAGNYASRQAALVPGDEAGSVSTPPVTRMRVGQQDSQGVPNPYARAVERMKFEANLPPEQRTAAVKARTGKPLTTADKRALDRVQEQRAAAEGFPIPAQEIARRKMFGPGSVNPRTGQDAAPPSGLARLADAAEEIGLPTGRAKKAESYEQYRNLAAQGKVAAPPVKSDKPEFRAKQEADQARINAWVNRNVQAEVSFADTDLEKPPVRPQGYPEAKWQQVLRNYQSAKQEKQNYLARLDFLDSPQAAGRLGVKTQFGRQLLKAIAAERRVHLGQLMPESAAVAGDVAVGGLALLAEVATEGAVTPLLAGLRGGRVAAKLGQAAKAVPPAIGGATGGAVQQAGTAYLGGERDPGALVREAGVGAAVGGALGGLGGRFLGGPNPELNAGAQRGRELQQVDELLRGELEMPVSPPVRGITPQEAALRAGSVPDQRTTQRLRAEPTPAPTPKPAAPDLTPDALVRIPSRPELGLANVVRVTGDRAELELRSGAGQAVRLTVPVTELEAVPIPAGGKAARRPPAPGTVSVNVAEPAPVPVKSTTPKPQVTATPDGGVMIGKAVVPAGDAADLVRLKQAAEQGPEAIGALRGELGEARVVELAELGKTLKSAGVLDDVLSAARRKPVTSPVPDVAPPLNTPGTVESKAPAVAEPVAPTPEPVAAPRRVASYSVTKDAPGGGVITKWNVLNERGEIVDTHFNAQDAKAAQKQHSAYRPAEVPVTVRGYSGQPDPSAAPGPSSAGATRFGPGEYFSDNVGAAEVFAAHRGPGAKVIERDIPLGKAFHSGEPDMSTPEFSRLMDLFEAAGGKRADIEKAALGVGRASPFEAMAKALADPGSKSWWAGADEANALLRKAGYDSVIGTPYNIPDVPAHTEYVLLHKPKPTAAPAELPAVKATVKNGKITVAGRGPLTDGESQAIVDLYDGKAIDDPDLAKVAQSLTDQLKRESLLEPAVKARREWLEVQENKRLAEAEKVARSVQQGTLLDAEEAASAVGIRNAGTATNKRTGKNVTYTNIERVDAAEREALFGKIPAARQGDEYTGGAAGKGATLRDLIVNQGILPDDLGVKLKAAEPKPQVTKTTLPATDAPPPAPTAVDVVRAKKAAAKTALDDTLKAEFQAMKDAASKGMLQSSTGVPDPEAAAQIMRSAVKIARAAANYGVASAEEFAVMLREQFGDVSDRFAKAAWDNFKKEEGSAPKPKPKVVIKSSGAPAPEGQSIKHAATELLREATGRPGRVKSDTVTWRAAAEEAEKRGYREKADTLAKEVLEGDKRGLSDAEGIGVAARLDKTEEIRKELEGRLAKAPTVEDATDLADLLDEQGRLVRAVELGGSQQGRDLNARKGYWKHDFSYMGQMARAVRDLGRVLTPEENAAMRKITNERDELLKELETRGAGTAERDARIAALQAELENERTAAVLKAMAEERAKQPKAQGGWQREPREKLAEKRTRIQKTREDAVSSLRAKVKAAGKSIPTRMPGGGPGMRSGAAINPAYAAKQAAQLLKDIQPEVRTIAKTLYEEGGVTVEEVVSRVTELLRGEGVDVDEAQTRALISGAVRPEPRAQAKSEWQKVTQEMRREFIDAENAAKAEAAQAEREAFATMKAEDRQRNKTQALADREARRAAGRRKLLEAREREQAAREARQAFERDLRERQAAWEKEQRAAKSEDAKAYREWWAKSEGGKQAKLLNRLDTLEELLAQPSGRTKPKAESKALDLSENREMRELQLEVAARENSLVKLRAEWERNETYKNSPPLVKVGAAASDLLFGVGRTINSSGDYQSPGLQGGAALFSDPKRWLQAWGAGAKAISSQSAERTAAEIRARPLFNAATASGVELPLMTPGTSGEDQILSSALTNLKGPVGGYFRMNARTYDANMTVLRQGMFEDWVEAAEGPGFVAEKFFRNKTRTPVSAQGMKVIADGLNTLTGRGAKWLGRWTGGGRLFYAVRYAASTLDAAYAGPVLRAVAYGARSREWAPARVLAQKYMKALGVQAGLVGLAGEALKFQQQQAGNDDPNRPKIETDVLHANYGKAVWRSSNPNGASVELSMPIASPQLLAIGFLSRTIGAAAGKTVTSSSGKKSSGGPTAAALVGNYLLNKKSPAVANAMILNKNLNGADTKEFGQSYDLKTPEGRMNFAWRQAPISAQNLREVLEGKGEGWRAKLWATDDLTQEEKLALLLAVPFRDVNVKR